MASATEPSKGITDEQKQELDMVFERARKALAIIETYDQKRVDRLCQAVAWAVANKRTFTRLVDMGIAESGLGDAVSRMGKRMKIRGVLRDALRQKSVGVIEELPEKGIVKYGKPAGIVACIVPTTNPDLTPAGNAIYGIKARDVVIFSPHPRSKKTSFETVRLMRERGIFAVPTFAIADYFAGHAPSPATAARERAMLDFHAAEFRKQLAAGVPIAMGSDVGPFPHGTQAGEFALMVKYGMPPLAAIQAGTLHGAKLLGWDGRIGALKAGYLADVIAVTGNPLEDIGALEKVGFVMKGGVVFRK